LRISTAIAVIALATVSVLTLPSPIHAAQWQAGDFEASFYSTLSASVNVRTQERDCNQVATINGGCNADSATDIAVEGALLNTDDGNLNWNRGDVFSVLFKGTHEIQADWRNYGSFVRFTYFMDMIQIQGDSTQRTPLNREARFRDNIMESGVNGAHFLLLDAYLYGLWDVGPWNIDLRVGNVALNWGESVFTQGGINAVNGLDVTKIRLPGSELREALMPAPMVRLASNIWGSLSTEVYYQFDWKRNDLDPVGSFFASSDQVSRGAQGFFYPTGCGDPGTPEENRNPGCPSDVNGLTTFPNGIPKLFDDRPSDQGQFGAALRYYIEPIDTEIGGYFIRHHYRYPVVSFRGTSGGILFNCDQTEPVPNPDCDLGYFIEFPEDIDVVGMSFNTLLGDWAFGGEISYRWNQPVNVSSNPEADIANGEFPGLQELVIDLLNPASTGGVVHGFSSEKRIVAMLNGIYVAAPATPLYGQLLQAIGASESNVVVEVALVNYPNFEIGKQYYAGPMGVEKVDATGFNYQIRVDMTYNRVFGSAWELIPTVAFRHDAVGNTPSGEVGTVQGLVQIGTSLEARFQNTWSLLFTYSNSFGAGVRNGSNDRDFVGFSASYAF